MRVRRVTMLLVYRANMVCKLLSCLNIRSYDGVVSIMTAMLETEAHDGSCGRRDEARLWASDELKMEGLV